MFETYGGGALLVTDAGLGSGLTSVGLDSVGLDSVEGRRTAGRVVLTPLAVRMVVDPSGFFTFAQVRKKMHSRRCLRVYLP
jgi:hypothetical protein